MEVRLLITHGKANVKEVRLGSKTIIGRSADCNLKIASSQVSRRHCQIIVSDAAVRVRDLGSSNGTFLNGKAVPKDKDVSVLPGNDLVIGPLKFVVRFTLPNGKPVVKTPKAVTDTNDNFQPQEDTALVEKPAALTRELAELTSGEEDTVDALPTNRAVPKEVVAQDDPDSVLDDVLGLDADDDDDALGLAADKDDDDALGLAADEANDVEEEELVAEASHNDVPGGDLAISPDAEDDSPAVGESSEADFFPPAVAAQSPEAQPPEEELQPDTVYDVNLAAEAAKNADGSDGTAVLFDLDDTAAASDSGEYALAFDAPVVEESPPSPPVAAAVPVVNLEDDDEDVEDDEDDEDEEEAPKKKWGLLGFLKRKQKSTADDDDDDEEEDVEDEGPLAEVELADDDVDDEIPFFPADDSSEVPPAAVAPVAEESPAPVFPLDDESDELLDLADLTIPSQPARNQSPPKDSPRPAAPPEDGAFSEDAIQAALLGMDLPDDNADDDLQNFLQKL